MFFKLILIVLTEFLLIRIARWMYTCMHNRCIISFLWKLFFVTSMWSWIEYLNKILTQMINIQIR